MSLSAETLTSFRSYIEALYQYNQKVNLVANADPEVVAKRHVLDCLALVEIIEKLENGEGSDKNARQLLDIGSGAGLPGLVIAIACPELKVVLLDSVGKKTKFLEETVHALALSERVSVINGRAEELARSPSRGTFDLVTSRAVGHLGMVTELALPLLKIGGRLLCQKSAAQVKTEIDEIMGDGFYQLGAKSAKTIVPKIQAGENQHVVVSIEKKKRSHDIFPRPWSEIIRHWK